MQVKGKIDSLNISSFDLEMHIKYKKDYIIEPVKSIGVFNPSRWLEEFKKPLSRNITEAKIIHTSTGLTIPIKRYSRSQERQVIEFAGLKGYNDKSKLLTECLNELLQFMQDDIINRIDVAIDFKGSIPQRVLRALRKNRRMFNWYNSTYAKTKKEKKTNDNINICIYPKHLKNNDLKEEIQRLEFSFKNKYFKKKYKLNNISEAYTKMQKSIKRLCDLEVAILGL